MECKAPKQSLLFPEKSSGEKESKRPPTTDDNGDEVQAFFSLVDRIQEMGKLCKKKRLNCSSATDISTAVTMDNTVIKGKSPWKPSFEWDDFPELVGKHRPCPPKDVTGCAINSASTPAVPQESDTETDKCKQLRNFDLNIEPSSDDPTTAAALTLFR